jgi:type II secretory pathway pseudopilin PulG
MKTNQKGFSVVEILIIMVVVGLLGAVGWLVYDRQNNKADNKTTSEQKQETHKEETTPDLYADWQTYNLKYEKLSFKYPKSYTVDDKSSDANPDVTPGADWLKLTKDNGFVISIQTGLNGVGGSCETCKLAQSKEVSFLGKTAYLNFRDEGSGKIGQVIVAANNTDLFGGSIKGKNVKSRNGNTVLPMGISVHYENDGSLVEKPLQTISNSDDIAEAIKILETASY